MNGDTDVFRAVPQALAALLFLALALRLPRRRPRRLGVALRAVPEGGFRLSIGIPCHRRDGES